MDFQDCIQYINDNPACALATIDGDQPRVRGMYVMWARGDGIYFTTGAPKSFYSQLMENPKIELCFFTANPLKSLRVTGVVELITDLEVISQALEERPYLKAFGSGRPDDPGFIVFRVAHGEAHFWTWEYNMREAEIPRIRF